MRGVVLVFAALTGCGFGGSDAPTDDTSPDADTTDESSDDDLADDSSTDTPDAMPFDFERCTGYEAVPGAPSRYRWGTGNSNAWDSLRDCANDLPGLTHSIVLETIEEQRAFDIAMIQRPGMLFWAGGVQRRGQSNPGDGWLWVTDAAWRAAWQPEEPTDWDPKDEEVDGDEHDYEQFVRIDENGSGMVDAPGGFNGFTLCECDGQPVTAEATDIIDSYAP